MAIVKLNHICKNFKIPTEKQDSLRERFVNLKFRQSYKKLQAVNNISLEIPAGEWLGIIGANGSGKSTLLKLIAGIYEPDQGQMEINGRLVPFLELGVGFNPELSARDNIFLNGVILGMTRKKIIREFDQIVKFAGIKPFLDLKLKNFSSGMQVRLAFAVAIQSSGEIYLLDEVLAVGDWKFQKKVNQVFKKMKQQGKTVILVSHDLVSIKNFCDRAVWLSDGKIISMGRPKSVIAQYTCS